MREKLSPFAIAGMITLVALPLFSQHFDTSWDEQEEEWWQNSLKLVRETQELEKQVDIIKLSETLGHFIANQLTIGNVKLDLESVIRGMRDSSTGKPAPMSEDEYEVKLASLHEQTSDNLADVNRQVADAFMETNAKALYVVELERGKLQYEVLQAGNGAAVEVDTLPVLHYTCRFIDGEVFGSSDEFGGPVTLSLDQTIPGFTQGILGMREGEKRILYVHPDLAYGDLPQGSLPPNSLLTFEVEVVHVNYLEHLEDWSAPNKGQEDFESDFPFNYYWWDSFRENENCECPRNLHPIV